MVRGCAGPNGLRAVGEAELQPWGPPPGRAGRRGRRRPARGFADLRDPHHDGVKRLRVPLADEVVPEDPNRSAALPAAHLASRLARAVGIVPEPSHRRQVLAFAVGCAVRAQLEEAGVEGGDDVRTRSLDVASLDRRRGSRLPNLLAPFLDEVGIAVGRLDEQIKRIPSPLDGLVRPDESLPGCFNRQLPDRAELE